MVIDINLLPFFLGGIFLEVNKKSHKRAQRLNMSKSKDKNKKMFVIFAVLLICLAMFLFYIFFYNNGAKKLKIGNNSSSQEIVDYILNISSYETKLEVEVKSNKNSNKYVLKQQYSAPDVSVQEVLEPSNIAGVKIIRDGNSLKLENSNLNLISVYNDYDYISSNILDLSSFLEEYKNNEKSEFVEKDDQIIMKSKTSNYDKTLYVDRKTALPIKMEIKDNSKKNEVYILYNEVKINSLNKEEIIAFENDKIIALI